MLDKIGKLVQKKPLKVIAAIILITIFLSLFMPYMKVGTSLEDFLPENDIVKAYENVNEYFGGNYEILMINVEGNNVVSPEALKEEYRIVKKIEKIEGVEETVGVANFVNNVCQMEYRKSLLNCSNEEVETAFNDLMLENKEEKKALSNDDLKDSSISYADIKNFYIEKNGSKLIFSIEVYDLSYFAKKRTYRMTEWYISFRNKLLLDEKLNISYRLSARIEPYPIWEIGNKFSSNVENLLSHGIFSYEKNLYLWIKPKEYKTYFPVKIEGNVSFDFSKNRVIIEIEKEELQKFGIAMKIGDMEFPARIGDFKAGARIYSIPYLRLPVKIAFIENFMLFMQNSFLAKLSEKLFNISSQNILGMLDKNYSVSLKDIDKLWHVIDEAPDKGYANPTLYIKPSFMEGMKNSSFIFLSNFNGKKAGATLMLIKINGSLSSEKVKEISKEIAGIVKNGSKLKMEITGSGVISYQIDEMTNASNRIIIPSIFIAIMLILFFNFKRISYVFLPLIGLGISIIWLFGTMTLLGMKFNTMAVALIPLIMGLGVDYSIHLFHNYVAEVQKGQSIGEAIASSVKDVGNAMFLATLTTCIGFLSFLTSTVPPLRDFGILCAIGIVYTFIVTITLLAASRYIIDKKKERRIAMKKLSFKNLMERLTDILCRHPKKVLLLALLVTLTMGISAINLQTAFSMEEFLPKENPAIKTMEKISEEFPFSSQEQEYILIEGNIATVKALEGIYDTHANIEDDEFVAKEPNGRAKVVSILSIIQKAIEENKSLLNRFDIKNGIPQSDEKVKELYDYLYEKNEREVRTVLYKKGNSYNATLIRIYIKPVKSNKEMEKLFKDLNDDIVSYGNAKAIVTGEKTLMYTITSSLTESQLRSTLICIIFAAFVIIIAYRKPLFGLITMVPVIVSAIWILGTMYFMGYSLNVMTVMITSLTIGLGITYAIHAVERFRIIADKTGDVIKAIDETVGHTGGALLMAAVTTIAGFGMLIFSPMPPERQFGVVTAITILYSFITTILILPPLLMFWGKWRKKKKGYIISKNS